MSAIVYTGLGVTVLVLVVTEVLRRRYFPAYETRFTEGPIKFKDGVVRVRYSYKGELPADTTGVRAFIRQNAAARIRQAFRIPVPYPDAIEVSFYPQTGTCWAEIRVWAKTVHGFAEALPGFPTHFHFFHTKEAAERFRKHYGVSDQVSAIAKSLDDVFNHDLRDTEGKPWRPHHVD